MVTYMAEREEIIVGNPPVDAMKDEVPEFNPTAERARLVEVLGRGVTVDRLAVPNLPADLHGEWVRDDPFEIESMRRLGFRDGTEYAQSRASHGDGLVSAKVADVVYMVCDRRTKEIIDDIRNKESIERNAPKQGKQKEEKDYENLVRAGTQGDVPTTVNSQVHRATPQTIADAVKTADAQTRPK
jgi:hypothetical protein